MTNDTTSDIVLKAWDRYQSVLRGSWRSLLEDKICVLYNFFRSDCCCVLVGFAVPVLA